MANIITITGRKGQYIIFDEDDERTMVWTCSLLPDQLKDDLRTHEHGGKVTHIEALPDSVTIIYEPYEWTAAQAAEFIIKCYGSYFCRRYKRSGKQLEYSIT